MSKSQKPAPETKPEQDQPSEPRPARMSPEQQQAQALRQVQGFFMQHPMSEDQQERAKQVRDAAQLFAETVLKSVKPCADQTAAIRKIREASLTAVQAISLEEYLA